MDVTSIDKAGTTEDILTQKIFIGVRTVYVHVTFQAVSFCPDSLVNGLMLGHEVALQTQRSNRLLQKPRVGRAMRIVAINAPLLVRCEVVDRSVLIWKGTLVFSMTGETFQIYV